MKLKPTLLILTLTLSVFVSLYQVEYAAAGTPAGTITYNAGTDTITVIGANSSHPAEFLDLYNADVAGGWGQITQQATNQYGVSCKIVVGNGSALTYFTDTKKQVTWNAGICTANNQILIASKTNATITIGTLESATLKTTSQGCSFINLEPTYIIRPFSNENGGTINIYSSQFTGTTLTRLLLSNCNLWNCLLINRMEIISSTNINVYNCFLQKETGYHAIGISTGTFNKITLTDNNVALYAQYDDNLIVTNFMAYRNTKLLQQYGAGSTDRYLINGVADTWAFTFDAAWTGKVYRQYEYDLTVLNGEITDIVENANVTLTKNGVNLGSWLTNSSGQIPTQTLTYGFYNQTGGNTMYDGAYPFYLAITHDDWANYTSKFYCTEKTNWVVSMQNKTDLTVYQTITQGTGNMLIVALLTGLILAVLTVTIVTKRRNR